MSRVLKQLAKRAIELAMYCTAQATSSTNVNQFGVLSDRSSTNVLVKGKLYCAKDAHRYLSMTCNALCKLAKESSRASHTMQVHKPFCNNIRANGETNHNMEVECNSHELLHSSAVICLRQLESCMKVLPHNYELPTETVLYIISIIRYATSHKSEKNENNNNNNNNNKTETMEGKCNNSVEDTLAVSQCELEELLMRANVHVSMFSLHQWKWVWLLQGIHAIARLNPLTQPPMLSDMCVAISSHLSSISPAASATLLWSLAKLHLQQNQQELWSLVCQRCRNVYRSMNEVSQLTLTYALLLANDCTCTAQERLLQLSYESLQECNSAYNRRNNINMSNINNNSHDDNGACDYNSYNDVSVNGRRNNTESNSFNRRQTLQSVTYNNDKSNFTSDFAHVENTSSTRLTIRDLLKRQSYSAIKLHLLANTHAMSTEVLLDLISSVLTNICHGNHSHLTRSNTFRKVNLLEKDMELARNVRNWQNEIALIFLGQETYEKYALTGKQNIANHEDEFHQLEYILSQICQKSLNERTAVQLLSLSLHANTIYKSYNQLSHESSAKHNNLSMLLKKAVYRATTYLFTLSVSQLREVHTVLHLIAQVWVEFGDALFHKRRELINRNVDNNNYNANRENRQCGMKSDMESIDYAECLNKIHELLEQSIKRITTRVERKVDVDMLWSLLISYDLLQITGYSTKTTSKQQQQQHEGNEEIQEIKNNSNEKRRSSSTAMSVAENNLEHLQQQLTKLVEVWLTIVEKGKSTNSNMNSRDSNVSCIYKLVELIVSAREINLYKISNQSNSQNVNDNLSETTLRASKSSASMLLSFTLLDKALELLSLTYLPSCTNVNVIMYVLQCTSFTLDQEQQESMEFHQRLRQVYEIATRQLEQCPMNKHTLDAITACLLCNDKISRENLANQGNYNTNNCGEHTVENNNYNSDDNKLIDKPEKSIHRLRFALSSSSTSFEFPFSDYSRKMQLSSLTRGEWIISDQLLDLYIRLIVHYVTANKNKTHHNNSKNAINADYLTVLLMCCEQREYTVTALEQFYKMLLTRRFGQTQSFIDCIELPVYALVQLATSALLLFHLHSGMAVGILSTLIIQFTQYGVAQCGTIAELNSIAPLLSLPAIEQLKLRTSLAKATVQCAESLLQQRKLSNGNDGYKNVFNSIKSKGNELREVNKKEALMKLLSYTDTPLEKGYFIAYLTRAEINVPESLLELMRAETAIMTTNTNDNDNNTKVSKNSSNFQKENCQPELFERQEEQNTNSNHVNDTDVLLGESSLRHTKSAQMYANTSEFNLEEHQKQKETTKV